VNSVIKNVCSFFKDEKNTPEPSVLYSHMESVLTHPTSVIRYDSDSVWDFVIHSEVYTKETNV
jgi:hypothetical protein